MKNNFSKVIWGTFLLLAAAFLLVNQFDSFKNIRVGSIIVAILALIFFVQCIANLRFSFIPIPLAVLYIIFQKPFDLPFVKANILILSSALASVGLTMLIPKKRWSNKQHFKVFHKIDGFEEQTSTEESYSDNNPVVGVNVGAISRHLFADNLETVRLTCNFGALEIFFDQVTVSPNGAVVDINCSFGAVKLLIPRQWHIIDKLNCSLGGVDMDKNFAGPGENTPQLTLTGGVSLGGIEVKYL